MSHEDYQLPEQFDDSVIKKCKEITDQCQSEYVEVKETMAIMRASEQTLIKFENKTPGVTYNDVKEAKESYIKARKDYLEKSKLISDGMSLIYAVQMKYPKIYFLLHNYNCYLAKLLASREARNPVENMVLIIAEGKFSYSDEEFSLTVNDERKGKTLDTLKKEYIEELITTKNRLESRYIKRQLATRIKKGEARDKIIKELKKIITKDPDDIKTYLLLSNLLYEQYLRLRDHGERSSVRQEIIDCLDTAFSKIDVYLDIQGVEKILQRDKQRVSFVKSIAALRKPLIKK